MAMKVEKARVLHTKGMWKNGGYEGRYGLNWKTELRAAVNEKLCSIFDIIDYMIDSSTDIYAGSTHELDFSIYHDALTQLWTPESIAYVKGKGFGDRFLRCMGKTKKGTRYHNKLVGDSPELCRGLDAYGFADFKRMTERMRALTSVYALDDVRRFNFGTPKEAWHTLERSRPLVSA